MGNAMAKDSVAMASATTQKSTTVACGAKTCVKVKES